MSTPCARSATILLILLTACLDRPHLAAGERAADRTGASVPAGNLTPTRLGGPGKGHAQTVAALTFSPDGKLLLSCGLGEKLLLWDGNSGAFLRELPYKLGPDEITTSSTKPVMAFSPDGKLLAAARSPAEDVRLWNIATLKMVRRIPRLNGWVDKLAFSPDSKKLALVGHLSGEPFVLHDLASGKEVPNFKEDLGHADGTLSVLFSPDGKLLAVGGCVTESLRVWELGTGRKRLQLRTPNGYGCPLAFAADGRSLVWLTIPDFNKQPRPTNHVYTVQTLELATGKDRADFTVLGSSENTFYAICCPSPDGRTLAMGGGEGTIRLYDRLSGKELLQLKGHGSSVTALAFSPDGKRLASGGSDKTVLLWDLKGVPAPAAPKSVRIAPKQLPALWEALAGEARPAYEALRALAGAPEQAVTFLRGRLLPGPAPVTAERLAGLIADLNARQFAVREKALQELAKVGNWAGPALRKVLADGPPLEVRRRVEQLLARLDPAPYAPRRLQTLRAVEALEEIGGAAVRQLFEELARTALEPWLAEEAGAAARRLAGRRPAG